ncbi:MAG: protein kinase domain-containing protein [Myxococcota bacterium]
MSVNSKKLDGQLEAGQMLGRYEMLLPIATGGMGNVWAARLKGTRGFRKLVAVKTVLQAVDDEKLEQMLFQEATLASQIHHPNVVETIELGEHEGTLYLVMELVFGESLSFILREAVARGGVPLPVAVNLVGQVCRGLQAAHDLSDAYGNRVGLVHRDISPSNVLVTYSGNVKIVDFGVATTAANAAPGGPEIKGKLSYLAPEQLRGEAVDARVDVYATGLLLYLMTVQKHPFRGSNENDTIARILSEQPVTPPSALVEDYPEALEVVLLKALEKHKDRRYASAAELLEALEAALPEAFGPNGDRVTLEYLEDLLKQRMVERRATLRMAEELSEQSSARDSAASVPAMVASHPHPARSSSRNAVWAAGSLLLTLGVVAVAAQTFLQASKPVSGAHSAAPGSKAAPEAASLAPAKASAEDPAAQESATPSARTSAVAQRTNYAPPARVLRSVRAAHADRNDTAEAREAAPIDSGTTIPTAVAVATSTASAVPEVDASAALQVGSGLSLAPSSETPTRASASVAAVNPPPPSAAAPKAGGPRKLSSKLGHGQLAVNPTAEPFRAHLPRALERSGQTFSTTVNICVNTEGSVTGIGFLRSADPGVDREVSRALSRWRYRPLIEGGRAVPFCYVLKYEIDSR